MNLSAAEGHPASVMDMSFAAQVLATEWSRQEQGQAETKSTRCPRKSTSSLPRSKPRRLGICVHTLTAEQKILESWEMGT